MASHCHKNAPMTIIVLKGLEEAHSLDTLACGGAVYYRHATRPKDYS